MDDAGESVDTAGEAAATGDFSVAFWPFFFFCLRLVCILQVDEESNIFLFVRNTIETLTINNRAITGIVTITVLGRTITATTRSLSG
jgi:hypothetical protein